MSPAGNQPPQTPDLPGQGGASGGQPLRVLTLQTLERFAVTRQPQLLVAQAQIGIAEGTVEQARSPFFPQITAIGQYEYGNSIRAYSAANGTTTAGDGRGICCLFSADAPNSLGIPSCSCAAGLHTCGAGGTQVESCSAASIPMTTATCGAGSTQVASCL